MSSPLPPLNPAADSENPVREAVLNIRDWFAAQEQYIWVLVFLVLLADFLLTLYGFQLGLVESNPFALSLLAMFGAPGIFGLKLGVLLLALFLRWLTPDQYGVIVPLSLIGPWSYAVAANAMLILRVV